MGFGYRINVSVNCLSGQLKWHLIRQKMGNLNLCVSLATRTCTVWLNMPSRICLSNGRHFKYYVDTVTIHVPYIIAAPLSPATHLPATVIHRSASSFLSATPQFKPSPRVPFTTDKTHNQTDGRREGRTQGRAYGRTYGQTNIPFIVDVNLCS